MDRDRIGTTREVWALGYEHAPGSVGVITRVDGITRVLVRFEDGFEEWIRNSDLTFVTRTEN